MQARSALFDAACLDSTRRLVRLDLLENGIPVTVGGVPVQIPVSQGNVSADRSNFARRTLSCVVPDEALSSFGDTGLLRPYGRELRAWLGVALPTGPEWLCLGTFGIRDVQKQWPFDGLTVTGMDRAKKVIENAFLTPAFYPDGWAVDRLRQLLTEASPLSSLIVHPDVTDVWVPALTYPRGARDKAVTDLVASLGCEVYVLPLGDFYVRPVPDQYDHPDFDIDGAQVLIQDQVSLSRDGVFNATIALQQATGTDAPISSDIVYDDDPLSPTYWSGPFGHVTDLNPIELPTITSVDQANVAAAARLRNRVGLAQTINWTRTCNPAFEPSDVGRYTHPDGTVTQHVLDYVRWDFDPGTPMQGQSRAVTVRQG